MKLPKDPSKFSFGATSSTVTSLVIIFGLLTSTNPRAAVIGALLVIAVADNIADSLGMASLLDPRPANKHVGDRVGCRRGQALPLGADF